MAGAEIVLFVSPPLVSLAALRQAFFLQARSSDECHFVLPVSTHRQLLSLLLSNVAERNHGRLCDHWRPWLRASLASTPCGTVHCRKSLSNEHRGVIFYFFTLMALSQGNCIDSRYSTALAGRRIYFVGNDARRSQIYDLKSAFSPSASSAWP